MLSRVYSWLQVENWSMTLFFFYIYTENTNSISTKCLTNYIYIYICILKKERKIFSFRRRASGAAKEEGAHVMGSRPIGGGRCTRGWRVNRWLDNPACRSTTNIDKITNPPSPRFAFIMLSLLSRRTLRYSLRSLLRTHAHRTSLGENCTVDPVHGRPYASSCLDQRRSWIHGALTKFIIIEGALLRWLSWELPGLWIEKRGRAERVAGRRMPSVE